MKPASGRLCRLEKCRQMTSGPCSVTLSPTRAHAAPRAHEIHLGIDHHEGGPVLRSAACRRQAARASQGRRRDFRPQASPKTTRRCDVDRCVVAGAVGSRLVRGNVSIIVRLRGHCTLTTLGFPTSVRRTFFSRSFGHIPHGRLLRLPGFVLLDLSGPLEAFASAESAAPGTYRLVVLSSSGGEVASSTGLSVATGPASEGALTPSSSTGDFSSRMRPRIESRRVDPSRIRSSTTYRERVHGRLPACGERPAGRASSDHSLALYAQALRSRFPRHQSRRRSPLHQRWKDMDVGWHDGGIDMAQAMIEDDLGLEASKAVARTLVVHQIEGWAVSISIHRFWISTRARIGSARCCAMLATI